MGSYAASLSREALGTTMEIRDRPQDNNHAGSWMPRLGDARADRYRHHATEGKLQRVSPADAFGFSFCSAAYSTLNLSASSTVLSINVFDFSRTVLRLMG